MSGCKTSYLSYFLINNYEMVKVIVRLKQLVVSVFLFLAWFYKSLGESTTDSIG